MRHVPVFVNEIAITIDKFKNYESVEKVFFQELSSECCFKVETFSFLTSVKVRTLSIFLFFLMFFFVIASPYWMCFI